MEGEYVSSITGKSSLFKIVVDSDSKVYRYDVSLVQNVPGKRESSMTKLADSHTRNADVLTCRRVIQIAYNKTNGFGHGLEGHAHGHDKGHFYCYDGKASLYSLHKLESIQIQLTAADINEEPLDISLKEGAIVSVSLIPNDRVPVIDYSNFKDSLLDTETYSADHSVRTLLELLTTEFLISTGNYKHTQMGSLYHTQAALHDPQARRMPGVQIFEGLKKGVRIVDEKTAWLIVDMLRSIFYASSDHQGNAISLAEVYRQFVRADRDEAGKRRFENHFKGVRMVVSYDTSRTVQFFSMTRVPISNEQFNVNGGTVADFYKMTHDIDLKYTNFPGVQTSFAGIQNNIVYPLEVLYVLPGQLIPQEKTLPEFENSIRPAERYEYIMRQISTLCTGAGALFLKKFGIKIHDSSNDVTIHCRALPNIRVMNEIIVPPSNGSFLKEMKRAKFLHAPNRLHNWIVAFDERIDQKRIEEFIRGLLNTLKNFGVTLPKPLAVCPVILDRLEEVFVECKKATVLNDFILYIDDKNNDSHGRLKLFEAKYKVLTQHVTLQAIDLPQQTLKGISMKLNSKCYGLNFLPVFKDYMHDLDLEKNPDLLVIGYDVAHPTAAPAKEKFALKSKGYPDVTSFHPSVVGICANKNENFSTFAGDFFFQESRREELSGHRLQKAIREIIECSYYSGQRAGIDRKPARLVIIRDGISEGQYKMAMERELTAIYAGYEQGMMSIGAEELAKKGPKITFLIATKRHNKRFFRVENGKIMNTQPGDVVNEGVVRKDVIDETFFQTHNAIKGTAQLTQYTVLLNDLEIPMLKIQEFMLMLSFMHQVSACPTSLPLPVYLADETAKRGQIIYNEWHKLNGRRRKGGEKEVDQKSDDLSERFDQLTEELHYGHSSLVDTRYNS